MTRYALIAFFSALLLASPALANDLVANCGSCGAQAGEEAHEHAEGDEAAGCENCGTDECTCAHHEEEAAGCEHCGTAECTCDHNEAAATEAEETDEAVEEAVETAEEATE